jgi:hypothetical protein
VTQGALAAPASSPALRTDDAEAQALLARAGGENFPVAPRWLPRGLRDDLLAIYGFARLVDESGDTAPGDRLARLDAIESDLERAAGGAAQHPLGDWPALSGAWPSPVLPVAAERRDQVVALTRLDELRAHALLGHPVGELVLHAAARRRRRASRYRTACAPRCKGSNTARTSPRTAPTGASTCRPKS